MDALDARSRMVEQQLRRRGIQDPMVLAAFAEVPREAFVPAELQAFAYHDMPLPIGDGQTISQTYIVALTVEALQLRGDERVLEIGTGSGYEAAILGHIVPEVYSVERLASLADGARTRLSQAMVHNVHVMCGDGTLGWPEHAPYDAIAVSASGPTTPPALLAQLAPTGRMVIPVGDHTSSQVLLRITRDHDHVVEEALTDVRFVPLIGAQGWEP